MSMIPRVPATNAKFARVQIEPMPSAEPPPERHAFSDITCCTKMRHFPGYRSEEIIIRPHRLYAYNRNGAAEEIIPKAYLSAAPQGPPMPGQDHLFLRATIAAALG